MITGRNFIYLFVIYILLIVVGSVELTRYSELETTWKQVTKKLETICPGSELDLPLPDFWRNRNKAAK